MAEAPDGKLDPAVVAALYDEYGEELKRFLVGLLRDGPLAHDAVQATFAKMIQRGHETNPKSRKAWLFRVAYNEAMAVRRRQGVGQRAVRRMAWNQDAAHPGADQPLLRSETVETVREALEELPEPQRQIVRMRIYEEKTFAVIAEELDIPLGTALGRMRSAMAKLREKLEEHDG